MSFSPETAAWINENSSLHIADLLLKAGNNAERRMAAMQLQARRKAKHKLPALAETPGFVFPTLLSVEQCTGQLLAAFHASLVAAGSTVADLSAGLGIDAMEFARKAERVTAVEINPDVASALESNAALLGLRNMGVVTADSMQWLSKQLVMFDVAFIDPYRRDKNGGKVFRFADCEPDIVSNLPMVLRHCRQLIIKASPMLDISQAVAELGSSVQDVLVLGTHKECKELLFILTPEPHASHGITAVTIFPDGKTVSFPVNRANNPHSVDFVLPSAGHYIYEPWPAVMKSGAFGNLAFSTGTMPLAPATHVFSSPVLMPSFPGNAYVLDEIMPYNKKSMNQLRNRFTHLDVAARNFPVPAPELEKKLRTKPGGTHRLLAITDSNKKPYLLLLSPANVTD